MLTMFSIEQKQPKVKRLALATDNILRIFFLICRNLRFFLHKRKKPANPSGISPVLRKAQNNRISYLKFHANPKIHKFILHFFGDSDSEEGEGVLQHLKRRPRERQAEIFHVFVFDGKNRTVEVEFIELLRNIYA